MTEVTIFHEKPMSIMAIVSEMREHGYIQKRDFDFAYYPAVFNSETQTPRHTVFTFYVDSVASWFALKYSK
jgi:hypothetical protein